MARMVAERPDVIPMLGEIFREYGYEGASLAVITEKTRLGKGSLYHFFPGGKEEMATVVLQQIDAWLEDQIYRPLRESDNPRASISAMCRAVSDYFRSGCRVCLVGAFALDNVRDRFASAIVDYFTAWKSALAAALQKLGHKPDEAADLAEEAVANIQGALVLARALNDPAVFERAMLRIERRLL
ncbi:TetR/AcrR family transcriptional regulator [Phyllobacterium sp. 628]|uniref:TetR/AcrR family transcriptional regulator n=1 Tax=Phyllobacterium sp. 628 TaxID=2718938 RepID=UPI0016627EF4|nr:TetR/AcrR family transcriptional regulator [Phyllobacterium sp. 628]QND53749.1 TetR/AcrR family transcriptional regulator [Phyllobacterium sp. 628]